MYQRSNHEIDALSFGQKLGLITNIISASDTRLAVRALLRSLRPDVVHIHNTFLMVSPSVYEACQDEDVPVVQTLHNYRLLCPASTFYRDGAVCEDCVTHGLLRSVQHACYRDSYAMSAAVALILQTHRSWQTWSTKIDAYIAISNCVKDKFVESGFSENKIHVKPNFVDPDPGERSHPGNYALFVGRLSPEKGLSTLVQAWQRLPFAVPLVIAGDGPMRHDLETEVAKNRLSMVHFAGRLGREEVYDDEEGGIPGGPQCLAGTVWPHRRRGLRLRNTSVGRTRGSDPRDAGRPGNRPAFYPRRCRRSGEESRLGLGAPA
jgi:glycosyltransferase involved in cell wall biosynthesis